MKSEIADDIDCDSIARASLNAADAYPHLKILCVRCSQSVLGSEFRAHFDEHVRGRQPPPAHWEAL